MKVLSRISNSIMVGEVDDFTLNQNRRLNLFYAFSFVGILSLFVFSVLNIFVFDNLEIGLIEVLFLIFAVLNLAYLKFTKNIETSSSALLLLMIIILNFLFLTGGLGEGGILWFHTFPLLAFFLKGRYKGSTWILSLLLVVFLSYTLQSYNYFSESYDAYSSIQLFSSLLATSFLAYFASYYMEKDQNIILDKVKELTEIKKELDLSFENLKSKGEYIKQDLERESKIKTAILNVLEDVEEEKKKVEDLTEDLKKFQLAAEYASDHIIITNPEGIIVYANSAVQKITGFKRDEVLGKKAGAKELWGGLMSKEFYEKLWQTIKIDKKPFSGKIQNKRKGGEKYWALSSISPVLDKDGEVKFFVGIERDITKEEQVDQAKTEFVSLASHQLRTPLSAINWYTEMLVSEDAGKLNEEQKSYLREIYDGSQRMVALVGALLNVSRLELGTFIVEPKEVDLKKIIEEVIKENLIRAEAKKIKINRKYNKTPLVLNADEKLANIIFDNFISNAVKYTGEGGEVTVYLKEINRGESACGKIVNMGGVIFGVKDDGIGIPESQKDKIFSKLFRADNVKMTDTEGTGLGLYIVKKIIDNIGGEIMFISEEGKGSEFCVIIPKEGMFKKEGSRALE